jgi:hypothetical protein
MSTEPEAPPEKISKAPVVGGLVVLALALAIAFGSWLVRDDTMYTGLEEPGPSAGADPAAVDLRLPRQDNPRCMPVDAENLGRAETAFDGEVLAVEDDGVTLAVREWYAGGGDAAQVRLDLAGTPTSLAGYFAFENDRRYLVAANDATVMVCGFSGPYSDQLATVYDDAFEGRG